MNLEDYQALISVQGKEEMQLILPARDMFSDEIRIFITNSKIDSYFKLNISGCWSIVQCLYEEKMRRDQTIQWLRKLRGEQAGT